MTYSSGGLIEASDYNGFVGGDGSGSNVSGQLNTVYATGYGNAGYGQTAVTNVTAVTDQVTAAQWTTLVNAVNVVRKHQSGGSFTNLATYVSGNVINATQDVSTNLTTAFTNRLTTAAAGPTYNQPNQTQVFTAPNDTNPFNGAFSRTVTFGSADQARYFFNAGGTVQLVISSVTNTGGTVRGSALGNVISLCTGKTIGAQDCSAITTPAPYTEAVDLTTDSGYYPQTTANLTLYSVSGSVGVYTSQLANLESKVS